MEELDKYEWIWNGLVVLVFVFAGIGFIFSVWTLFHWRFQPQPNPPVAVSNTFTNAHSEANPDADKWTGKYCIGTSDNCIDPQEVKNRLDALDGGKEKKWACKSFEASWYEHTVFDEQRVIYNGHGEPTGLVPSFANVTTTRTIITTIGAETPKQLGYEKCTQLP